MGFTENKKDIQINSDHTNDSHNGIDGIVRRCYEKVIKDLPISDVVFRISLTGLQGLA